MKPTIHAGFIPLVDCAPLVMTSALGLDAEFGFSLRLHREASWANIRDKTALGLFDCAHMLAPMALAGALGLGRAPTPIIAPMALNLNGNAITVSNALYDQMCAVDQANAEAGGMAAGVALAKTVAARREADAAPLTLGMVYPFSCHNYDLRYWLAAAGVHPDNDVRLVVVPPPLIAGSLEAGEVDGFCVGAPWGSVTVAAGLGRIVATKFDLWPNSPEKVLGVRQDWAEKNPNLLMALMQAVLRAAAWLDDPEHRVEAAAVLARAQYVGAPEEMLRRALTGRLLRAPDGSEVQQADFIVFHRYDANFPWISHAIWLLTQMRRWGQITEPLNLEDAARRVFRPDLYRRAAALARIDAPAADARVESLLFGGETFDPARADGYAAGFAIHS